MCSARIGITPCGVSGGSEFAPRGPAAPRPRGSVKVGPDLGVEAPGKLRTEAVDSLQRFL